MNSVTITIGPYKVGNSIVEWLEKVDDFITVTIGEQCSGTRKLAILKTVIGEEASGTIKNFNAEERSSYDNLVKKLESYYRPSVSTSTYRHQFYSMYQEEAESVEDFVNRLLDLAVKCGFRFLCKTAEGATPAVYHDMTSEFVKDRLMVGLYDEQTRGRLMRERTLTLESAVEIAKTAEAAKAQLRQTARRGQSASVNAMQKKGISNTYSESE